MRSHVIRTLTLTAALGTSFFLLATSASTNFSSMKPSHLKNQKNYQLVQACGWYAISLCSTSESEAKNAVDQWGGGYVVDTDDEDYPNFAGGYFCAVSGAKTKSVAQSTANRMKSDGWGSAYIKNAC